MGAPTMAVPDPARAVADRFFAALEGSDWDAAAAECDADVLTSFRDRAVGTLAVSLQFAAEPRSGSGGAVVGHDMIADALAQMGDTPMYGFRSADTVREAAALSGPAFLSGYFAALDEVYAEASTPRLVVGIVHESGTLAHVLYRRNDAARRKQGRVRRGDAPPPPWTVTVLTLRQRDGEWRALLNGEIASERLDFIQVYLAPAAPGDSLGLRSAE